MIRAYCYATGLIGFGQRIPKGAVVIARGPDKELRDFIDSTARHGYRTRRVNGRPTKVKGSDTLLVPGLPEADSQSVAMDRLLAWLKWISASAPKGVRVHPR